MAVCSTHSSQPLVRVSLLTKVVNEFLVRRPQMHHLAFLNFVQSKRHKSLLINTNISDYINMAQYVLGLALHH